jgi:hypothetical protein
MASSSFQILIGVSLKDQTHGLTAKPVSAYDLTNLLLIGTQK